MRSFGSGTTSPTPNIEQFDQTESSVESEKLDQLPTISETSLAPKTRRSLITRRNIYKTIEKKLNSSVFLFLSFISLLSTFHKKLHTILHCSAGYNGHNCLLRAICEASEIPLGLDNGVLGDIMHIIFT